MKLILSLVVVAVVMGLAVQHRDVFLGEVVRYEKATPEVVTQEAPKEAWMMDEEAIQAAKDVIRKKELQAELDTLDAEIKAMQERRKAVASELTAYWRDQDRIKQLIREVFWEDPVTAVAVAMAESELKPYALNTADSHNGCNGSYGIFQIGCLHETDPSTLYDVEYNIRRAKEIYNERGWQPWGAFTDKRYTAYLHH